MYKTKQARAVKKLVNSNRYTLRQIARLTDCKIEEIPKLYRQLTGQKMPEPLVIVGKDKEIKKIMRSISRSRHVLIHGIPGVGKTACAIKCISDAGKTMNLINISDKRTPNLILDQMFGGHLHKSDTIFLWEEVDNFYWRSHATFKKILESSEVSIIMTCNDMKKIPDGTLKWIKKNCDVIKFLPASIDDVNLFISRKFPHFKQKAEDIYDKDMRVVMRRIMYGYSGKKEESKKWKTQQVVGSIFGSSNRKRILEAIRNNSDPYLFLTDWLDYNTQRMFHGNFDKQVEMLECLSIIDSNMRRTRKQNIEHMFASLPLARRRVAPKFPSLLLKANKKPKKKRVVEESVDKVKIKPVIVAKEQSNTVDVDDF